MNIITQLITIAFLVEAIWETLKMVWQDGKANKDRIGSLLVGLALAFTMNVDLFVTIGLTPQHQYVGVICAGIIVSRGGNFVHDLVNMLNGKDDKDEARV